MAKYLEQQRKPVCLNCGHPINAVPNEAKCETCLNRTDCQFCYLGSCPMCGSYEISPHHDKVMSAEKYRDSKTEELQKQIASAVRAYRAEGVDAESVLYEGQKAYSARDVQKAIECFDSIIKHPEAMQCLREINTEKTISASNKADFIIKNDNSFRYAQDNKKVLYPLTQGLVANNSVSLLKWIFKTYGKKSYALSTSMKSIILVGEEIFSDNFKLVNGRQDFSENIAKAEASGKIKEFYGKIVIPSLVPNSSPLILVCVHIPSEYRLKINKKARADFVSRRKAFIEANCNTTPENLLFKDDIYDLWAYDISNGKLQLVSQNILYTTEMLTFINGKYFFCNPIVQREIEAKGEIIHAVASYSVSSFSPESGIDRDIFSTDNASSVVDTDNYNNHIILSSNGKSNYNIFLKSVDMPVKELAENIYEYMDFREGCVFYTVGNKDVKTLFSLNIRTGEKIELEKEMKNNFGHIIDGWRYFDSGNKIDGFSVIRKTKDNSKQAEVVIDRLTSFVSVKSLTGDVANNFENAKNENYNYRESILDGKFWYNYNNRLHCVNLDGTSPTELTPSVKSIISYYNDRIYYLIEENKTISLYSMKIDGSDRTKHINDIIDAMPGYRNTILFTTKVENVPLSEVYGKITHPVMSKKVHKLLNKKPFFLFFWKTSYAKRGIMPCTNAIALKEYCLETKKENLLGHNVTFPTLEEIKNLGRKETVEAAYNQWLNSARK